MTDEGDPSPWWTGGALDDRTRTEIMLVPGFDPVATREDCVFDVALAHRPIDFIEECCSHVKGALAGKRVHLEPWERAIVLNMFGWVRTDGRRRFREVLLFVPRKNGKSLLCAAIGLYIFFCDREAGAEIYCAAAEREQASLVWNMGKQMIAYEPELARRCRIYYALRSIENPKDGSYLKPLSSDALTKHGFNAHAVLFDELHTQPNADMLEVLETSMGARTQPLMIYLTTSDFERPGSPCNEKHEYATKVRDGIVKDKTFLPIIYEAQDSDDWSDPKVWAKANPNLGVSVSLDYLDRACKRAKEQPSYQNSFKRLHLNIRTRQDIKWLDMDRWNAAANMKHPTLDRDVEDEDLHGAQCYGGLDLASVSDLCALVLWFPEFRVCRSWFWLPSDTALRRMERNRVPYPAWAAAGLITLTPGNVADYDKVRHDILALHEKYYIRQIAIDRWNSTQLQTQLVGDGIDVMPFGQGFGSMNAPAKELERLVASGQMGHGANPVLDWCASNVMIEQDAAGNIKPSKKKSTEKIDGIVSLVMALGAAMLATSSVYESSDLLVL